LKLCQGKTQQQVKRFDRVNVCTLLRLASEEFEGGTAFSIERLRRIAESGVKCPTQTPTPTFKIFPTPTP